MQQISRQTTITITVIAFLVGIILGRNGVALDWPAVLTSLGVAVVSRRTRLGLLAVLVAGLGLGIWRGAASLHAYDGLRSHIGQTASVLGVVADDPSTSDKGQVGFTLDQLRINGTPTAGQISVYSYRVNLQRGYTVQADGKLAPGFGNKPASLSFGQLQVRSTQQDWLERLRQRFFTGMRTALPEPLAGFALGLLVGARSLIPKNLQATLTLVGLSHLVAVSGYNLTILANAASNILGRRHKFLSAALTFWLIIGFVAVTGASASIVRAALVAILVLIAGYSGFRIPPLTIIATIAATTVAWRPEYLTSDLGWQLSFTAFIGIMVLAPLLQQRLLPEREKPRRFVVLRQVAIESFAAQLLTTPLIIAVFGKISVIAPLSNALILPMVPLVMLASFVAGLAGMFIPLICGWFAWPAAVILRTMLDIIIKLSEIPGATMSTDKSTALALGLFAFIGLITLRLYRGSRVRGLPVPVPTPMQTG